MRPPNQIFDDGFYNEDQKKRFLNRYDEESTRNTFARILNRAKEFEEIYEKDLYDFNEIEIAELLTRIDPLKATVSRQNGYIIQMYIRWAIEQGLRSTGNINPLDGKDPSWYDQFVDKTKKVLFTKEEIDEIVDKSVNYQDAVIIQLIFEGVCGTGYEELLSLREKDIDWDNNILTLLPATDKERHVIVSDKAIRLIRGAIEETEYESKNGEANPNAKNASRKLLESEFVLRNSKTRNITSGKVDKFLVLRRIDTLSEYFDYPYLTVKSIRNSGMLYMAKEIYVAKGTLEREYFDGICEVHNIGKVKYNGQMIRNQFPYTREFLNIETIKEVYEIE